MDYFSCEADAIEPQTLHYLATPDGYFWRGLDNNETAWTEDKEEVLLFNDKHKAQLLADTIRQMTGQWVAVFTY